MDIIAIDGPSGVGKSSVSRVLARRLGYLALSSGLVYRAIAWCLLRRGWAADLPADLTLLEDFQPALTPDGDVIVAGEVITPALHTPEVAQAASRISILPAVRERSNALQRAMVAKAAQRGDFGGVILEGRDIGTVVFPDATHKFYLDAAVEERAGRRFRELAPELLNLTLEDTLREQQERDRRDAERDIAPLRAPDDAITVDTTALSLDQVVTVLLEHIHGSAAAG